MKIDIEKILLAHKLIIEADGGLDGIKDYGAIESVVENVYNTFEGIEIYPTKEDKASYLVVGLIKAHGFNDGNKRTGINTLLSFLNINGVKINVTEKELEILGKEIASSDLSQQQSFDAEKQRVKDWIISHKI